ncbi:unnamed protein product [Schistosoma margrebowiei]|uniref:Uncharacterized protein n=1 Tax=Schistosoma margrebowiei TaxID=48269 RepID=A0A183LNX2_9TREM|nr:unnamed protein product [Schistosoma margrebowiei]
MVYFVHISIAQRDPISGRGNFGDREWDPIGRYNGKTRRAKSSTGIRTNPLTGENVKTFTVMAEERCTNKENGVCKRNVSTKNIFTGENCENYTVSPELKSPIKRVQREPSRNAITGENCATYDYNSEVKISKKRTPVKISNPLNGENVSAFMVSQEERPRTAKPYVYRNTVTGENLQSYKITPIERNVTPRVVKDRQNPLSGENVESYTYRLGESKRTVKKRGSIIDEHGGSDADVKVRIGEARAAYLQLKNIWNSKHLSVNQHLSHNFQYKCQDSFTVCGGNLQNYDSHHPEDTNLSSPLTGDGSRGRSYTISIEEKHLSQPNLNINEHDSTHHTLSSKSLRNILTGENCITYNVCQEMRSEKVDNTTMMMNGNTHKKCKIISIYLFKHINIGTTKHQIDMHEGWDTVRVPRPKQLIFLGSHTPSFGPKGLTHKAVKHREEI